MSLSRSARRPNTHPVWGRTCAASSATCMLATAFLACQTRTKCRTAEPGEGQPPPRYLGVRKGQKTPFAIMRIEIWSVRWGRIAGARCETRRRRALAECVRCMECKIESCSPPLAAMLHEGVWLRDGKSGGAWGFTARARRARDGGTLPPVRRPGWMRGAFICGRCVKRFMQANGGGGKCAPCRRASLPAPASAKTWPIRQIGGGWGQAWH